MKIPLVVVSFMAAMSIRLAGQAPDNLVAEGIPTIPEQLNEDVGRYLEFRGAGFESWHPKRREMLIVTRFADTAQLHYVKMPGGARKQITFFKEPVRGGGIQPVDGSYVVFSKDTGGSEFYQLYRFDFADGKVTLLTDGRSRNTGARFARSGKWIAYTSTRRTGKDNDIYLMNPRDPAGNRLLVKLEGGGWGVADWAHDESKLLVVEYVSINESYLHLADTVTGAMEAITPRGGEKVSYGAAAFARDGKSIYVTTDKDSEFQRLVRIDLATRKQTALTAHIDWDVDEFELSPDGKTIAFVTNEDGIGVLHLLDTRSGKEIKAPKLPAGIVVGLDWHENGQDLAFNLTSARSPFDVYSVNLKTGKVERWTESETGGLDVSNFAEPELIKLKSFDGLPVSGFLYRPDPKKFSGKRPVILSIHGGPESQSRPGFQGRNNYHLNELGVAILYPNVRGSAGYGKTFLTLDNGFKREDSVRDIQAFIDWIRRDPNLDGDRIAVTGASYGGFMTLACMVRYADQLRCGVDVVGISNFVTFLNNTEAYRRDLRRAEYGDERDARMREFLERISPANHVEKITKPLFVVQGRNDPRVPFSESEQMVKAIRDRGGRVWYLMAKDEGHGFAKKSNADFQFLATIQFFRENLLK